MIRSICLTTIALLFLIPTVSSQNYLDQPEGVIYDTLNNRYLVSNWGSGSIVEINSEGSQSYFRTGLGNCANMCITADILWVCCNNRYLRALDLETGATIQSLTISTNGLHDVCADTSGYLYCTNWNSNIIYRVKISDYSFGPMITSGLSNPLGILFDPEINRLLIGSFGGKNDIQAVDLNTFTLSTAVETPFIDIDDLAWDAEGRLYVTTWSAEAVWQYDHDLTDPPQLVGTGTTSMTDLCFNPEGNELAVTHYTTDSISFISLEDADSDGAVDIIDNCPGLSNPNQLDTDSDNVGDPCDNCPEMANMDQDDFDSDEIGDECDNCPLHSNPDQEDVNNSGIGDICEACCGFWTGGYTGNANNSDDGKITLSDITRLIDYVYISKLPLECPENGNANGSLDGKITLSDITRLIDHVYISKGETAECP